MSRKCSANGRAAPLESSLRLAPLSPPSCLDGVYGEHSDAKMVCSRSDLPRPHDQQLSFIKPRSRKCPPNVPSRVLSWKGYTMTGARHSDPVGFGIAEALLRLVLLCCRGRQLPSKTVFQAWLGLL